MSSRVAHLQLKIHIHFLAGLHRGIDFFAVLAQEVAAVEIHAEVRINPITVVFQQPFDAVRRAALFVCGERKNHVAVGDETILLPADEICDQNRVAVLDVHGAAAVEVAVFLHELKGIRGPVFSPRFHHVEMRQQENGLLFAGARNARDQILLPLIWTGDDYILLRKSGIAQALRHSLRRRRDVSDGIRRIDLD